MRRRLFVFFFHAGFLVSLAGAPGCSGTGEKRAADLGGALPERTFRLTYEAHLEPLPEGAKNARLWLPLPQSDGAQAISSLRITAPVPWREGRDSVYGNRMASLEVPPSFKKPLRVVVEFEVLRREVSRLADAWKIPRERLLSGDHLAPITEEVRKRAAAAVRGKTSRLEKARAIYRSVLASVDYDKSGIGWGRGDIEYVCREGKGNCSDFHALFIAMCRAAGIPAVFEIGFPLPSNTKEGEIGGYHCWAWFEDEDGSWRPVDVSEADKHPELEEYYFGTLDPNRVALTRGRDLVLEPPQKGPPLNFFVYPYLEVDGRPHDEGVSWKVRFRDLEASPDVARESAAAGGVASP